MTSEPLTTTLRETLDIFEGSVAPLTTAEVAEELNLSRRSTYDRLDQLVEQDYLNTKKVGANARVWWTTRQPDTDGTTDTTSTVSHPRLKQHEIIFEHIEDGVYTVDDEGQFVMVNDAYTEMTGYSRDELIGEHVTKVVDEGTSEIAQSIEEELRSGSRDTVQFEAELRRKTGDPFPAEATFALLPPQNEAERVAVVRDVSDRVAREQRLERQRDRLEALNALNRVFRDVTDAVIDQYTREEIETTVCDRLAASDAYQFAWIGGVDLQSETITVRTQAGTSERLEDMSLPETTDDGDTTRLTADAVLEKTVVTSTDSPSTPTDAWLRPPNAATRQEGVAIPILSNERIYAVLNIASDRRTAFDGEEQALLRQLGEVIGHAITAIERKQALTSDDVVELEFEVPDVFDPVDLAPTDGAVLFDRPLRVHEEDFIVYATATEDVLDAIEAMVASEAVPSWDSVSVLEDAGDRIRFELHLSSPVLATIADHGGYIQTARIDDGDLYICVHLDPNTDVRQVVEAIRDANPTLDLLTQRRVNRDVSSQRLTVDPLLETLTDRQRTVLEAAYERGYFAWPRDDSGDAIAEALDIAPSTFHQHVRRAEVTILNRLFEDDSIRE